VAEDLPVQGCRRRAQSKTELAWVDTDVASIPYRCNHTRMGSEASDLDHIYLLTDAEHERLIRQTLTERGLTSYMNDTKWRELCRGIYELPFPPAYQVKYVYADDPSPLQLQHTPTYLGDWAKTAEASLGLHIEWLKIAPRYSWRDGRLTTPKFEDCSSGLIALLTTLGLVFTEEDGFVVLYGHGSASTRP
jgi:hypothetical protein